MALGSLGKHEKRTGGDWGRTERDQTRRTKTKEDQIGQKQNVTESDRDVEKMEEPGRSYNRPENTRKH